jgi:hypothetical protein
VTFTFRAAFSSDRPALLRLFEAAFGSPAEPEMWAWKFDRNPHRAPSALALHDGRAVGFYGGWATRYRGAGRDLPGCAAVDVMTDPAARSLGGGLFAELSEVFCSLCREAGIPFYFGFPNERHRLVGERKAGYVPVEPAGQWARPLGAPGVLPRLRRRFLRFRTGEGLSPGHDALAERLHARPGWRTDRSRATLDWRFAPHAGAAYRVVELSGRRGAARGYAVTRLVGDRALLVDFQVRDEASADLPDLLQAVEASLEGAAAARLELRAASSSPLSARLEGELGFAPAPADCHFEVRPLDPALDALAAGRTFDYRFADHEIF